MRDQVGRLSALLHKARETHHTVYRMVDGNDADWASWYADWLMTLSELMSESTFDDHAGRILDESCGLRPRARRRRSPSPPLLVHVTNPEATRVQIERVKVVGLSRAAELGRRDSRVRMR